MTKTGSAKTKLIKIHFYEYWEFLKTTRIFI